MSCSCFADMNVGYVLDEAQLTRYFSQYGTVTDCYLPVRTMMGSRNCLLVSCWLLWCLATCSFVSSVPRG